MKRKALIIYCDNTPPSDILEGPPKDNENYRKFLTSKYGGAWVNNEIISIQNPTRSEVEEKVLQMNDSDYTLTIFTGHGDMIKDNWGTWTQRCQVLDGDIYLNDLNTGAKKKTIIIDACRKLETYSSNLLLEKTIKTFALFDSTEEKKMSRNLFDKTIINCEDGLTVLYSSRENQASDDSPNGGVFLCTLLRCVDLWKNDKNKTILRMNELMELAIKNISTFYKDSDQKPMIKPEKRNSHYPFAVKLLNLNY